MATVNREIPAVLFLTSAMMTLDAYSTFQSSPWTIENFGADEEKAKACREYLMHAVGFSTIYAIASTVLAKSPWPLIGASVSNGYLMWLYGRALNRGMVSGSANWVNEVNDNGY